MFGLQLLEFLKERIDRVDGVFNINDSIDSDVEISIVMILNLFLDRDLMLFFV